ncbi:UDP-N-acetylglucosamine 2-epimerase [Chlorobium sp. N1]|uniref:UDP-N-acetylglucosamine 2-epimerase n=1 Tax=Chlorobium sp. N1 TaxID=2491138 RepID=UPI001038DB0E|nr:UDP-N-acetylglucosamine 2-epimerase [Chlorobium sp. N1]TCD48105.1 UDP-N-acetyl glucosamine 2-epimerase [Chlorobium sp. N1]
MKHILLAAGGPQGMLLLGPLYAALKESGSFTLSAAVSEPPQPGFSESFGLSGPDFRVFDCGSPAVLSRSISAMDEALAVFRPDLVIVCGSDVPALAAALAAGEIGLPVVSAEAGLRSYDRLEADEMHRMLIDTVALLHVVSEHSGEYNLINEGVAEEDVLFAGNLRIDALRAFMERGGAVSPAAAFGLTPKQYALVLPEAGGDELSDEAFFRVLSSLGDASDALVLLPAGSALRARLEGMGRVRLADLPAYGELLALLRDASMLLQAGATFEAEATVMNVPCLTMQERTARPSTLEIGTNVLVGLDAEETASRMLEILQSKREESRRSKIPEKWDGAAASRISAWLEEKRGA